MDASVFEKRLQQETAYAERVLREHLPKEEGLQEKIMEAMNYSLLAGGKRLRPILMRETYRMCGGEDGRAIERFMAAIEMIHTYSLVHDDLPAMDNDRYRRGKETTWYVYGETMGILAGDGLLNYAFETAIRAFQETGTEGTEESVPDSERLVRLERASAAFSVLARKAGIYGMIGGQVVDVMAQEEMSQTNLLFIHAHKTAALIQAAMMAGAILAGADREQVAAIEKCAYNIGIAFQIQDDILDVIGDSEELGKATGSDAANRKETYVTRKGLEQAKADVEALSREAAGILDGFTGEHEFLKQLILTLIHRRK
ncbi:polyprenyl synthetase family protein [Acetatifactor aquisgranensis]|uniref:polyprenyl synthetase family protein n=1 Tax=Acetatifactor aquisgranensis TaxID=2941233 RepID=UPI00203EDFBC|nr:farnesyl diphosphate synthase [Acetatifactor aquisgranensis]